MNEQITVKLLDSMGNDLSVVNAARVSMGKKSLSFSESDEQLIKYLAKHNHWSPFAHASVSFHVRVPIFVERQIFKHVVGFTYNSISGRYVEFEPDFYIPDTFRQGSPSIKQGSLEQAVESNTELRRVVEDQFQYAFSTYRDLLAAGVCKEQARSVLPLATMTEFVATGTLYAWARMYNLRSKPDAQRETQEYSRQIGAHMASLFPVSWQVLTNGK